MTQVNHNGEWRERLLEDLGAWRNEVNGILDGLATPISNRDLGDECDIWDDGKNVRWREIDHEKVWQVKA